MTTEIDFLRLTEVPPEDILAHMSDPRLAAHMPLLKGAWDSARVAEFVAFKEAFWRRDGLGHWAILVDGRYAGWGGFQLEDGEWDYGLVLRPEAFGQGVAITSRAIAFARVDPRIPYVTFLLPPTRRKLGALKRLGARFVGEIDYEGERFLKFRLETG